MQNQNEKNKHKSNLNEIKTEKCEPKQNEQKSVLYNIIMLYESQNIVNKFFDDYYSLVSEVTLSYFHISIDMSLVFYFLCFVLLGTRCKLLPSDFILQCINSCSAFQGYSVIQIAITSKKSRINTAY